MDIQHERLILEHLNVQQDLYKNIKDDYNNLIGKYDIPVTGKELFYSIRLLWTNALKEVMKQIDEQYVLFEIVRESIQSRLTSNSSNVTCTNISFMVERYNYGDGIYTSPAILPTDIMTVPVTNDSVFTNNNTNNGMVTMSQKREYEIKDDTGDAKKRKIVSMEEDSRVMHTNVKTIAADDYNAVMTTSNIQYASELLEEQTDNNSELLEKQTDNNPELLEEQTTSEFLEKRTNKELTKEIVVVLERLDDDERKKRLQQSEEDDAGCDHFEPNGEQSDNDEDSATSSSSDDDASSSSSDMDDGNSSGEDEDEDTREDVQEIGEVCEIGEIRLADNATSQSLSSSRATTVTIDEINGRYAEAGETLPLVVVEERKKTTTSTEEEGKNVETITIDELEQSESQADLISLIHNINDHVELPIPPPLNDEISDRIIPLPPSLNDGDSIFVVNDISARKDNENTRDHWDRVMREVASDYEKTRLTKEEIILETEANKNCDDEMNLNSSHCNGLPRVITVSNVNSKYVIVNAANKFCDVRLKWRVKSKFSDLSIDDSDTYVTCSHSGIAIATIYYDSSSKLLQATLYNTTTTIPFSKTVSQRFSVEGFESFSFVAYIKAKKVIGRHIIMLAHNMTDILFHRVESILSQNQSHIVTKMISCKNIPRKQFERFIEKGTLLIRKGDSCNFVGFRKSYTKTLGVVDIVDATSVKNIVSVCATDQQRKLFPCGVATIKNSSFDFSLLKSTILPSENTVARATCVVKFKDIVNGCVKDAIVTSNCLSPISSPSAIEPLYDLL